MLNETPLLAETIEEEFSERIFLKSQVEIIIATASYRTTRGFSFGAVIADEVSFWRDSNSANPDEEIIKALRPGSATIPGSILILASSPYAKRGVLYNTWKRHYGKDDSKVLVWQGSTADLNPTIDPDFLAEQLEDDPVSFDAEFGGNFRNDIASYIDRAVVDQAVVPGRHELPYVRGERFVGFIDPSGGSSDSFTCAVAHGERDKNNPKAPQTVVLDLVREIRAPLDPSVAVAEFAAVLKFYGLTRVRADRYAAEWPREAFKAHGIQLEPSEKSKSDLYRELLPLINSSRVELLDNPRLIAQLCSLERRVGRGRDNIDHPPNGMDDVINAAAGALVGVGSGVMDVRTRFRVMAS